MAATSRADYGLTVPKKRCRVPAPDDIDRLERENAELSRYLVACNERDVLTDQAANRLIEIWKELAWDKSWVLSQPYMKNMMALYSAQEIETALRIVYNSDANLQTRNAFLRYLHGVMHTRRRENEGNER